ncbi:hypothetical protein AB0K16_38115 [Nonomuraea jabiensis]|uniref:hypothetical protein n=1 Tax=Nonomuraea jabiensis TaxID=882448 RepID=UPI00342965C2
MIATLTALALAVTSCGTGTAGISPTIAANSTSGGKSSESADWIRRWVVPEFERPHRNVKVLLQPNGLDDEQDKTKIALGLTSRAGTDVIDIDGIRVGEFAQAGLHQATAGGRRRHRRAVRGQVADPAGRTWPGHLRRQEVRPAGEHKTAASCSTTGPCSPRPACPSVPGSASATPDSRLLQEDPRKAPGSSTPSTPRAFSLPVVARFLYVPQRYGFRFRGGIKA